MAKCEICGKKIERNEYKIVKGKVYCLKCWEKSVKAKVDKKLQDYLNYDGLQTGLAVETKVDEKYGVILSDNVKVLLEATEKPKKKRKYKKRSTKRGDLK